MNLSNRIKKIEEQLNLQEAVYCECDDKFIHSLVESVYYPEKNIKVLPCPSYEKGFCDKCKKSFQPGRLQFLDNVHKIYGSDLTK